MFAPILCVRSGRGLPVRTKGSCHRSSGLGFHSADAALAFVMLGAGPITLRLPHERAALQAAARPTSPSGEPGTRRTLAPGREEVRDVECRESGTAGGTRVGGRRHGCPWPEPRSGAAI